MTLLAKLVRGVIFIMEMISSTHLCKTYRLGFLKHASKIALNSVSLCVNHNEVFGIIGLNGAGKSTLLKILMGFVSADSGTARIAGEAAGSAASRNLIGYLPENPCLYPNLSITEHLHFGASIGKLHGQEQSTRIQSVLETVGLSDVANIPVKRFSKGMTQRAALAYAILLQPEILIFDEPMSGLDPLGRQLVIDIIRDYRSRGTTILFCSHILADVERICDRIGIMHQGNLVSIIPSPISDKESTTAREGKTPLESLFLQTVLAQNP